MMSPEPNEVKQALIEAKALIANEERWIKGSFERNNCYCAMGAIRAVCRTKEENSSLFQGSSILRQATLALSRQLIAANPGEISLANIAHFNDNSKTKHQDVLNLYTRTIETFQ